MDARVVNLGSLPIILGLIVFGLVQHVSTYKGFQCGIPRIRHEALIAKGNFTSRGEWPWHAAIYHRKDHFEEYACGGTLISYYFVLTSAHCIVNRDTGIKLSRKKMFVRLGMHYLNETDPAIMQQYSVENSYVLGKFRSENMRDDIGILKLEGSVQITDYVVPACINQQYNLTNAVGTSVGWGITENQAVSPVLKKAEFPVIDDIECLESDRELFGKMFHKGMFCAGLTDGTSMCNGDSGGGLFFKRGKAWYLGGIVSFSRLREHGSNLCYTEGYTAFTKIVKYLPWISNTTGIVLDIDEGTKQRALKITRLSDEKCRQYQKFRSYDSNVFLPLPAFGIVLIRDQGKHTCWANIISERYLLGTGSCFYRTFDKASFTADFDAFRYNFRLANLKPILHPSHNANTGGYVPKESVILIDLGRDRVELKPDIACLWTDPNKITKEVISSVLGLTELSTSRPFNISETDDGKAVTTNEDIACDAYTTVQGLRLSLQKAGENYHRLAGLMIDCEPSTYRRLTDYLDWIEEIVWPRET